MSLNVLQAFHQLLQGVQKPNYGQLNAHQGIPYSRTYAPQLPQISLPSQPTPASTLQPQPKVNSNLVDSNGFPYGQNSYISHPLSGYVNQYNQEHYVPPANRQTRLPAYRDLSGRQPGFSAGDAIRQEIKGLPSAAMNTLNTLTHPWTLF